jgi:hypothetical protein
VSNERITLKRTVYYDQEADFVCSCSGDFYKTCSLREINDLPCKEAFLSITPIDRDIDQEEGVDDVFRSIDSSFSSLKSALKTLHKKEMF